MKVLGIGPISMIPHRAGKTMSAEYAFLIACLNTYPIQDSSKLLWLWLYFAGLTCFTMRDIMKYLDYDFRKTRHLIYPLRDAGLIELISAKPGELYHYKLRKP